MSDIRLKDKPDIGRDLNNNDLIFVTKTNEDTDNPTSFERIKNQIVSNTTALTETFYSKTGHTHASFNGNTTFEIVSATTFYGNGANLTGINITGIENYIPIYSGSGLTESFIYQSGSSIGFETTNPGNKYSFHANEDDDINYVSIGGNEDKTRGFLIGSEGNWKWANYIFKGEDGDTQYFASGNSERDILCMQSGGRVGLNIPTLLSNIQILSIIQTATNTYATITCEIPHRLPNNTLITIEGATNTKYNGQWTITNVTTMTFRINGVDVGAISEEPTDAEVVIPTNIPAALAIFPQYFDAIYSYDKSLDTGEGTGFVNLTTNLRTSFGTPDIIYPVTTGSYLYIGKKYPWRATNIKIATASAGSSAIVVEYSHTSGGWTALTTSTTSGNGLIDSTNRLRQDGTISWNLLSFKNNWGHKKIIVDPAPHSTDDLYWIRIGLIGTITIAPTSKSIGNHGVDRFAVYAQSGDINPFFTVDQYGRVGILPAELETKYSMGSLAGLTTSKFEIVSEDGYKSDFIYYLANNTSDMHPAVIMARSGGNLSAKTATTNGMDVGALYGYAYDGSRFREIAGIKFESSNSTSIGNASGRIAFFTRSGTTASIEKMRITESGYIGIGQVTPRSLLDVNGGIRVGNDLDSPSNVKVGTIRYRADSNNSYCEICMQTGATSYAWVVLKSYTW